VSELKPLSERPKGYLLAVAGGLLGGGFGLILSPLVLFGLNQALKEKDGKRPNRFKIWAIVGIVMAPLSFGITGVLLNTSTITSQSNSKSSAQASKPSTEALPPFPFKLPNKSEEVGLQVKKSMQETLATDPNFRELKLSVIKVVVVHENGGKYQGIATVRSKKGSEKQVPVEVTAGDANVIWKTAPGSFLFALQE
jgi:hypothetical protein